MPHIIVEYSASLEPKIPALLTNLHTALAAEGIDQARIKTRGIAIPHAIVGDKGTTGQMLHVTFLLLSGRDNATKKQYGDALHAQIINAAPEGCAITLEIRDMDPDHYYM